MKHFLLLFVLTFILICGLAWLLTFCRRRIGRTRHGLTGMCHHSGGPVCASCQEEMKEPCDRGKEGGSSRPVRGREGPPRAGNR